MPTFNQSKFIEYALDSVIDQLDEIIIVNDGSVDDTERIAKNYAEKHSKVVYLALPVNSGTATAINTGRRLLKSKWQTWVSSDNYYTDDWISTFDSVITDQTGAVYSSYYRVADGHPMVTFREPYVRGKLISSVNCFIGPSFFIRDSVWTKAGDHRGKISHDYDHWLRVEEAVINEGLNFSFIDKPCCFYRVHPEMAGVRLRHQFDADKWQEEAKKRRIG